MATQLLRDWLAAMESELELEPEDLAGAAGVPVRTFTRWRTGESFPQTEARRRLDQLYDLQKHIRLSIGVGRAAREWMHGENPYLGMLRPVDVLRSGRIDAVEGVLSAQDHGFST
jgi:uncharacterized protein (DUF2384 family)